MYIRIWAFCCFVFFCISAPAIPPTRQPVTIPFDFSRSAIGLNVTIRGRPAYVLLDTGVDPSVIDLPFAEAVGLKVERQTGGEASGFGEGKGAAVFPSRIDKLQIVGTSFAPFDALASDMSALSEHYGRKLDGVLGYSFLVGKSVLIDYPTRTLSILTASEKPQVQSCKQHWTIPLRTVDSFPVIAQFRFGSATGPVTIDTGSTGSIALYQSALAIEGVRGALSEKGSVALAGARGESKAITYTLATPVGFGPFTLPAGQVVTLRKEQGSMRQSVANGGNTLFAALKLKMLLNYRGHSITFYGDCR